MRYTILLVLALIVLFTACKKKPDREHCYICEKYDSVRSNVQYYINANPNHFEAGDDTLCGYTDSRIDYFMKTHILGDTAINRHDTVVVNYTQEICEQF